MQKQLSKGLQDQLGGEGGWKKLGENLQKNLGVWGEFGEDLLGRVGGGVKRECGEGGGHDGKVYAAKVEGKEGQEEAPIELPTLGRWVMEDTCEQSQAAGTRAHSLSEDSRGRGKRDRRSSLVEEDNLKRCVERNIPLLQVENCGLYA